MRKIFNFEEIFYLKHPKDRGRGRQVFVKKIEVNNYENVEEIQF